VTSPANERTEPITLERPATGGAVGRRASGRVVFVRHALVGEVVRAVVTEETASFERAEAVEILSASPQRVSAPCPYAKAFACGGCDLQHASAVEQNSWKRFVVADHLRRIAGVSWDGDVETVGSDARGTRTRLRCGVDENGRLCQHVYRSNELVALDSCWISDERLAPAFSSRWPGASEVELRAIGSGEPFAVVRRETSRGEIVEIRSLTGVPLPATTQSSVEVMGQTYRVGPRSFWQSHRDAPRLLVDAVSAAAQLGDGDSLVDLYSGVGLFSLALLPVVGKSGRVVSVESSAHAVRDARLNAAGYSNIKIREWSVTPRSVNDTVVSGDVVVVDPPRTGLARGVADALLRRSPRRIVYVSCDAATAARDLKGLLAGGFELRDLRVLDLFPMTEHVEMVALLDATTNLGHSASGARKG